MGRERPGRAWRGHMTASRRRLRHRLAVVIACPPSSPPLQPLRGQDRVNDWCQAPPGLAQSNPTTGTHFGDGNVPMSGHLPLIKNPLQFFSGLPSLLHSHNHYRHQNLDQDLSSFSSQSAQSSPSPFSASPSMGTNPIEIRPAGHVSPRVQQSSNTTSRSLSFTQHTAQSTSPHSWGISLLGQHLPSSDSTAVKHLKPFQPTDFKVLLLESVNHSGFSLLEQQGYQVDTLAGSLTEDELIERIR